MRYEQVLVLIVTLFGAFVSAAPLPSFEDIEQRWLKGESEAQIHANHHIREASPAWLIDREAEADGEFSYAPDKRTLESRREEALLGKRDGTPIKALKKFVNDFMREHGKGTVATRRSMMDEAPVLKPKKTMRYYFSA